MEKKISIIIPVYNGSNYVGEAIESALAQTYSNKEIIVVNDGSTDDGATKRVVEKYKDKVIYYEKENGGVSTALNYGIEKMTGDYFSWLSHDDIYYPNKLKQQMEEMKKHDDNTILYSDIDMIDLNSKRICTVHYDHNLLMQKPEYAILRGDISGISLLIPKKAFEECGGFDEKLRCVQDYLKWFNFSEKYKFVHMEEVLAASRVHPKQVTLTSPKMITEGNWLWTYIPKNFSEEKMIEYEGSKYVFYKKMENYLLSSPYKEAIDNNHKMAEESLEEEKKKISPAEITVILIDNGTQEELEKTKKSIENQTYQKKSIIIEKKPKDVTNKIKTDYYTFLQAGTIVKDDWLEKQMAIAQVSKKSVTISDYKRPIRSGNVDNLCSFLISLDGVIFNNKESIPFENTYQYLFDIARRGGSIVTEESYLEKKKEEYNMDEVYSYLRMVLESNQATNYQIATLNYDISVIYNQHTTDGKKVFMYEDSDELKELKFSRSFQLFQKYYNYKKKKKKTI